MKTGSDSEDDEDDVADKHQGVTPAAVKDVDNPVDDCEVPAKSTDTVLNIAPPLTGNPVQSL